MPFSSSYCGPICPLSPADFTNSPLTMIDWSTVWDESGFDSIGYICPGSIRNEILRHQHLFQVWFQTDRMWNWLRINNSYYLKNMSFAVKHMFSILIKSEMFQKSSYSQRILRWVKFRALLRKMVSVGRPGEDFVRQANPKNKTVIF